MSARTIVFTPQEWYHCYTRGVDKRELFVDGHDRERFLMLLFACNSTHPIHLSNLGSRHQGPALPTVLRQERGEPFVDIAAYCLMDNHIHLVLRERLERGTSIFMQKIGTAYTMYFNKKYNRAGTLFSSRFKAKHVDTDEYLKRLINYVHANPAEIFEPRWKHGEIRDEALLRRHLLGYRFSSLPDYESGARLEGQILNMYALLDTLEERPSFSTLLQDAQDFYTNGQEC